MTDLKPCPFCGGVNLTEGYDDGIAWISCVCGAAGPNVHKRQDDDAPTWNTRAGGWQAIETAPKNWYVLVAWQDSVTIAKFDIAYDVWVGIFGTIKYGDAPTHWQLLPVPPEPPV